MSAPHFSAEVEAAIVDYFKARSRAYDIAMRDPASFDELVQRAKAMNRADWESFRHNWPMHLFELLKDFGMAAALGACLGLSLVIYVLERFA